MKKFNKKELKKVVLNFETTLEDLIQMTIDNFVLIGDEIEYKDPRDGQKYSIVVSSFAKSK